MLSTRPDVPVPCTVSCNALVNFMGFFRVRVAVLSVTLYTMELGLMTLRVPGGKRPSLASGDQSVSRLRIGLRAVDRLAERDLDIRHLVPSVLPKLDVLDGDRWWRATLETAIVTVAGLLIAGGTDVFGPFAVTVY